MRAVGIYLDQFLCFDFFSLSPSYHPFHIPRPSTTTSISKQHLENLHINTNITTNTIYKPIHITTPQSWELLYLASVRYAKPSAPVSWQSSTVLPASYKPSSVQSHPSSESSSPALPVGDPDVVEAESEQVMSSTLSVPASDSTTINHEKFARKWPVGTSSKGW